MANPGAAVLQFQETQSPISNLQKIGVFPLVITPAATAANTTAAQNFAATGIGLLVGDIIQVIYPAAQTTGIVLANAYCTVAADTLTIQFGNLTAGSLTAAAGTTATPYYVAVYRLSASQSSVVTTPLFSW